MYPEFLPDPDINYRNKLREKLERRDMIARRKVVEIPEFYAGQWELLLHGPHCETILIKLLFVGLDFSC